jgi:thiamine pyrophosphokinase
LKSVIISNGDILDFDYFKNICKDKFIICCDGAISHCINMGIQPDVWVGDKDSCTLDDIQFKSATCNCEIVKLQPQKDMTDTEYAFDIANCSKNGAETSFYC